MRRRSMPVAAGAASPSARPGGRAFAAGAGSDPILDHDTPVDLGGSEYVDLSDRAAVLAPPTTGTIVVTFRTTSHDEAMTLPSASDPTARSCDITLEPRRRPSVLRTREGRGARECHGQDTA